MDHAVAQEAVQAVAEVAHEAGQVVEHAAGHGAAHGHDPAQYILHHVADGDLLELPGKDGFATDISLKHLFGEWHVGGLDLTPTKLTVMLWIAAAAVCLALWAATKKRGAVPKGRGQTVVETLFLFVRDEIAEKSIGHGSRAFVPFLATCFFLILGINFLGLIPYGATATGNVNVTVVLAAMTFLMTQLAGMKAQGVGGYWAHLVPAGVPWWLYPLMLPIEFIGLFTKPFALTMRLFANMVAGHIVLFFILGLVFFLKSAAVGVGTVPLGFAIFLLETFVALVQAYVFTLLSAVFIGMASHAH
ncbi:MAG: hypothetical protein RL199_2368 [Pseudomonadota bacterium]|jgi:F-type H+-transporting ATPase subunit a